jgi:hypothetical protein
MATYISTNGMESCRRNVGGVGADGRYCLWRPEWRELEFSPRSPKDHVCRAELLPCFD